jgi:lysophospholipase L1-like esterase
VPVQFDGSTSLTIPAGGEAISDPVPVTVAADQDLTVSLYLPLHTGLATYHPTAGRTAYIAPGNQVSAATLANPQTRTSLYWLAGLDVATTHVIRTTVVAFGDSLTDGGGTTIDAARTYPDQLVARLRRHPCLADAIVLNTGLAGNRLLTSVPGEAAVRRAARDVFAIPWVSHVIIHLGLNDIGLPAVLGEIPVTAEHVIHGLDLLIRQVHAQGIVPIIGTLTPLPGARTTSGKRDGGQDVDRHSNPVGGQERLRQAVNDWIRSTQRIAAVADFDAALADPANPHRLRPAYDSGDHVHPNDAGARAMAKTVDLELLNTSRAPQPHD